MCIQKMSLYSVLCELVDSNKREDKKKSNENTHTQNQNV